MMNIKPLVIGISGGSAAGKTTVASLLASSLGQAMAVILEVDRYFIDRSSLSHDEQAKINYDIPQALDFHQLAQDLARLKMGQAVLAPEYDYATHSSRPNAHRIEPARVIIVEGILLFHPPSVASLLDFRIFVEADRDERLRRRMERDVVHRGRTRESVIHQFNSTVEPAYLEYTAPTRQNADVTLDWNGMNYSALEAIAGRIRKILE